MLTVLRPRDRPNCTLPSTRANRVSSPPRPTLEPGWNLVPRCRTMISPAFTTWPPKSLTRPSCVPWLLLLSGGDIGDLELGEPLTVAHPLVVTGLVLELVDADLGTLGLGDDLSLDGHLG